MVCRIKFVKTLMNRLTGRHDEPTAAGDGGGPRKLAKWLAPMCSCGIVVQYATKMVVDERADVMEKVEH